MPVLRELTRRYPQLQIEAAMTDRLVDLTEEGFDAAVRLGRVGDVRLIARPLAALRWVTVASPEYLRSHGTPERLEQLAGHNCRRCATCTPASCWNGSSSATASR